MIPAKEKIAIGMPRGSDTKYDYETMMSLFEMFGRSPCSYKMITEIKVHHMARNGIIEKFLKSGMNYLLFVDSDMIWEPDSLELAYDLIQNPQVDIVSGIYFGKSKPHTPIIKKLDLQAGCYDCYTNWGNKPFEVDGSGMGFMLIPRYVLARMKQPFCDWTGGFSEDLNFCLKAKKDYKFKIWAHPGIKLGHITKTTVTNIDWVQQHKPSIASWMRENKRFTTMTLAKWYPRWREDLGIHPLQFKNPNTKEYWDEIYKHEKSDSWRTYPEKSDYISKELLKEIPAGTKILELGCGQGLLATKLAKDHKDTEYVGMDISTEAVKAVRKAGFLAMRKELPPIELKDKFDVILALELLEHMDDKPRLELIKEIAGMLKENGQVILSVPDDCMPPVEVIEHRVKYNKQSFEKFLKKTFKNVKVESILSKPTEAVTHKVPYLVAVCRGGGKK